MLPGDEQRRLREWRELVATSAVIGVCLLVIVVVTLWPR